MGLYFSRINGPGYAVNIMLSNVFRKADRVYMSINSRALGVYRYVTWRVRREIAQTTRNTGPSMKVK